MFRRSHLLALHLRILLADVAEVVFFLLVQVWELLHAGLVQAVDYRVFALGDVYFLDLERHGVSLDGPSKGSAAVAEAEW